MECYGKTMEKLWNFFSWDLYEPCTKKWKYSGFSCHNNSHQSKDIVNCVVNILSSLGDGSSEVVESNIELNLTNLHFRSLIVFIFYVS